MLKKDIRGNPIQPFFGVIIHPFNNKLPKDAKLIIENSEWDATPLGLLNALADTFIPGAQFIIDDSNKENETLILKIKYDKACIRDRDLQKSLRDINNSLQKLLKDNDN